MGETAAVDLTRSSICSNILIEVITLISSFALQATPPLHPLQATNFFDKLYVILWAKCVMLRCKV